MTLAIATSTGNNFHFQEKDPKIWQKTLQKEENCYQVLHTTPGRIRIRIPRLAKDQEYADGLEQGIKSLPFVTQVRVNAIAKSIIIEYSKDSALEKQIQQGIFLLIEREDNLIFNSAKALTLSQPLETEFNPEMTNLWNWLVKEVNNLLNLNVKDVFIFLGELSFMLGIVGVILPLMPGTPFFILSSLCCFIAAETETETN